MGKRIGYIYIDQNKLNPENFVEAFGVLLSRIKVIKEEVDGSYLSYLAESECFEEVEDFNSIPHYDVKFLIEPRIEVFFASRDLFLPLIARTTAKTISSSLISVQPMAAPLGTTFYLEYKNKNNEISNCTTTQSSSDKTNRSRGKNVRQYPRP
jgi:hypothetical protein